MVVLLDDQFLSQPGFQMEYPKYESHCHGAPIYKLHVTGNKRKYICMECVEWCIAVEKK